VKNPVDDVKSSGVRLSSRAQFESAETIVSHSEYSKGRLNFRFLLSDWGDLNSRPSVPQIDAPQTADLRKRPETASGLPF